MHKALNGQQVPKNRDCVNSNPLKIPKPSTTYLLETFNFFMGYYYHAMEINKNNGEEIPLIINI